MAGVLRVLEYHLVAYRRVWRGSALGSFVLPLLSLLGFGVGVGAYVESGVAGAPYLDWLVPGLLASTAVQVAVGDASWPVFSRFEWIKVYYAQAAAPLRTADILGGQLAFIGVRVLLSSVAFLLVAAPFGVLRGAAAGPVAAAVTVLLGLAVAAPAAAFSASVGSDSWLAVLLRFAVLPMSLFSGVFFPVEALPAALRAVAYALPLWHGVDLCRAATLGAAPAWPAVAHAGYLAAWCAAGWWVAHARFRRRLVV